MAIFLTQEQKFPLSLNSPFWRGGSFGREEGALAGLLPLSTQQNTGQDSERTGKSPGCPVGYKSCVQLLHEIRRPEI